MYSKELEELIESVIADGVLTDDERQVLTNRAVKCGEDPKEVIIYVEGLIAKARPSTTKASNIKYGVVLKCPACGEPINRSMGKCPACGHIFTGLEDSVSLKRLSDQISKAMPWSRGSIIKNYPIPNTKEELLEFLIGMKAKANNEKEFFRETYQTKCEECIQKAQMSFPNDSDFALIISDYKKQKSRRKRNTILRTIVALIFLSVMIAVPFFIVIDSIDKTEDTIIQVADSLNHAIDLLPPPNEDNYRDCIYQIQRLTWPVVNTSDNSEEESQNNAIRSFIAKKNAYIEMINNLELAKPISFDDISNYVQINSEDNK